MDRRKMLWQMTGEQFAAFDVQLYLDTHPYDSHALSLFGQYQKSYQRSKKDYENMFGPISSDTATHDSWRWINDPWPWEREAN